MIDPRYTDPRLTGNGTPKPVRDENTGSTWGWIAGLAVVALIAFVVIAGWSNERGSGKPMPISLGSCNTIEKAGPNGSVVSLTCGNAQYEYTILKAK